MIAEGSFPSEGPLADSSAAPRVGDGMMVLDEEARVRYASPNAMSVFHRVGISANAVGHAADRDGLQRQLGASSVRDAAAR